MANLVKILVSELSTVLVSYDQIKIYRSNDENGTFTEITDASTRINLNSLDSEYEYTDSTGASTDWYKSSYFNSISSVESAQSSPLIAVLIPTLTLSQLTKNQLLSNMLVVITLSKDIKNVAGFTLGTDQEFFFTTTYDPLYSSVRKVRLEVGAFLKEISDDTINLAIFEASLMAKALSFKGADSRNSLYLFARREWTTCKAAEILLLNNLLRHGLRSKRLDNLEVTYDASQGADTLDRIQSCLHRWEYQIMAAGNATQTPLGLVKGELDIDDPHVGRMWEKGPLIMRNAGSNVRYRPLYSRRWVGGWRGHWINRWYGR